MKTIYKCGLEITDESETGFFWYGISKVEVSEEDPSLKEFNLTNVTRIDNPQDKSISFISENEMYLEMFLTGLGEMWDILKNGLENKVYHKQLCTNTPSSS